MERYCSNVDDYVDVSCVQLFGFPAARRDLVQIGAGAVSSDLFRDFSFAEDLDALHTRLMAVGRRPGSMSRLHPHQPLRIAVRPLTRRSCRNLRLAVRLVAQRSR